MQRRWMLLLPPKLHLCRNFPSLRDNTSALALDTRGFVARERRQIPAT